MARRRFARRRGGKRGFRFGKYFSLAGKILGAAVIASPAIVQAQASLPGGDVRGFANGTVYRYTGFEINTGQWNMNQAIAGIGTVAAGVVLMKIFSWAGKRM